MMGKLQLPKIEIGQVRKLDSIKGIASSRLVAIAEVDAVDATCLVFLLGNATDAATPRDVVISKHTAALPYDIALMGDYLSRADQGRLASNPIIGKLSQELIQAIRHAVDISPFGAINIDENKYSVEVGSFPAQKYDAIWTFRDAEAANFALLTFVRNKASLEFAVKFLQINHENPSAFDDPEVNLDAIRFRAISKERIEVAA
jgi:hypothetical protein